jgi:hypothetical protein
VAALAPPSVIIVPYPLAAGVTVPEIVNVFTGAETEAVKFAPLTLVLLTVVCKVGGLKLNPLLLAVTV